MKIRAWLTLAVSSLFLNLLNLSAETISVAGIRPGFATGADLTGLEVTTVWQFIDGPYSLTRIWEATGPDSGEASYDFAFWPFPMLAMSGDSRTAVWTYEGLYADPVLSVTLDGRAAGILFERASPLFGYYTNPVSVAGQPPSGDHYATLTFLGHSSFTFTQPVVLATPEPGLAALTAAALTRMAFWARSRRPDPPLGW